MVFSSICMGLKMTDGVTVKAFMITSGRFRMSFEISPNTFVRRR
jgi:hypothetical protein